MVVGVAVGASLLAGRPTAPPVAGAPAFIDDTAASGLVHRYDGPDLYQVGGGVAVFDCDSDGRLDLFLAGGEGPSSMYRNTSTLGGELRFERVEASGIELEGVNGAYPIDLFADASPDLAVLRVGESGIFRNAGCQFSPLNQALGYRGTPGSTTAFSATWEGDAVLPTLAFGRYLVLDEAGERTLECDTGELIRPSAATTTVYGPPIGLEPGYCALSMLFSDWDGSGRRDLRVSNDREWYTDGMEQLWRVVEGEAPRLYTADEGWVTMKIWGMGIASQDVTGDGLPEVYLTSQGDNKLQTLSEGPARPAFRDIALKSGVHSAQPFTGGESLPSTAWHPEFADVNNDGYVDLFVTKGNVGAQVGYATKDPNDLFLGQPDGTFTQAADEAGLVRFERGRGAAVADFNRDGLLDLVVVNYGADAVLWRNVGRGTAEAPAAMGHWLALDLFQPGSNRDAIGARIEVRTEQLHLTRELTIGGGHVGGQLGWTHVGLGPARGAEVRVTWPDGEVGPWLRLEADGFWTIERNAAEPVRVEPAP